MGLDDQQEITFVPTRVFRAAEMRDAKLDHEKSCKSVYDNFTLMVNSHESLRHVMCSLIEICKEMNAKLEFLNEKKSVISDYTHKLEQIERQVL